MDRTNSSVISKTSYWIFFIIATSFTFSLIFPYKYLPMIDIPQHASQIKLLQLWEAHSPHFKQFYDINWFTPYMTGIVLTALLSSILSISTSIKVVLFVSIITFTLLLRELILIFHGDSWWSFIAFPVSFGFNFVFGLYNFIVSIPIGLGFFLFFLFSIQKPPNFFYLKFFLFGIILFFSHAIMFCLILTSCFIFGFFHKSTLHKPRLLFSFLVLGILPITYLLLSRANADTGFLKESNLSINLYWRLRHFIFGITGHHNDTNQFFLSTSLLFIFIILGSSGFIFSKNTSILIVMTFLFFLGPKHIFEAMYYFYHRLIPIYIVFLILSLKPIVSNSRRVLFRTALFFWFIGWFSIKKNQFHNFDLEAQSIDPIIQKCSPNKSLLNIGYSQQSEFIYGDFYRNFYNWIQVEKGGILGWSFAMQPPQLVRQKESTFIDSFSFTNELRKSPGQMTLSEDKYDYYLIRSTQDKGPQFFRNLNSKPTLLIANQKWWLYKSQKNN